MSAPAGMTAEAAAVWDGAVAESADPGALNGELLRAWCETVVELRACEAWVREHGSTMVVRDDKGNVKQVVQAPKYVQVRALRADLVKLGRELGVPRLGGATEAKPKPEVSKVDELAARRTARVADPGDPVPAKRRGKPRSG